MTEAIKAGKKSWKTTAAAVLGLVTLVAQNGQAALDLDPATVADWSAVVAYLPVLAALWFARDNDVSSEAAGVK